MLFGYLSAAFPMLLLEEIECRNEILLNESSPNLLLTMEVRLVSNCTKARLSLSQLSTTNYFTRMAIGRVRVLVACFTNHKGHKHTTTRLLCGHGRFFNRTKVLRTVKNLSFMRYCVCHSVEHLLLANLVRILGTDSTLFRWKRGYIDMFPSALI